MPSILRLETIQIIGQRNAFFKQIIPKSSSARKGTVDPDILITSRNGDRKIMQPVSTKKGSSMITSGTSLASSAKHMLN